MSDEREWELICENFVWHAKMTRGRTYNKQDGPVIVKPVDAAGQAEGEPTGTGDERVERAAKALWDNDESEPGVSWVEASAVSRAPYLEGAKIALDAAGQAEGELSPEEIERAAIAIYESGAYGGNDLPWGEDAPGHVEFDRIQYRIRAKAALIATRRRTAEGEPWEALERIAALEQEHWHMSYKAIPIAKAALAARSSSGRCESTLLTQRCELHAGHSGNHRVESREKPGMFHGWSGERVPETQTGGKP